MMMMMMMILLDQEISILVEVKFYPWLYTHIGYQGIEPLRHIFDKLGHFTGLVCDRNLAQI